MSDYAIGVDLGGTNLRAAAISREGKMMNKAASATPMNGGCNAVITEMVRLIETIHAQAGGLKLAGVGIGVPGFILMDKGIIAGSANLPEFVNYPVRDEVEHRLGAKVILENDANAAALGEKWMGAGSDVQDLILLTLGTGIGGGIISEGRVLHGYLGMAGEIGHMTVVPNGNPCGCGNIGCFEKYASATAVSAMAKMLNLGPDLSSEQVYELAKGGNARAVSIFQAVGRAMGTALASLINVFNFPLYLIGGGMAAAWDLFEPSMRTEVSTRSFSYRTQRPRIERAALGGDAGLFGAAYLPLQPAASGPSK